MVQDLRRLLHLAVANRFRRLLGAAIDDLFPSAGRIVVEKSSRPGTFADEIAEHDSWSAA